MSRRNVADKRGAGRTRELLEAARSQSNLRASRAARGDALPQLRHQVQIPVPVHPLPEHVSWTCVFFIKDLDCSLASCAHLSAPLSPQDRPSLQVAGHAEVRVCPLHG